jgi:hypothetical protein
MSSDHESESGPTRTCIVTREAKSVEAMVRFVVAPDNRVTPDLKRSLPGRGVWVTAKAALVRKAVERKAFARALKQPVEAADSLAEDVAVLARRRALEALSLANKAGAVTAGASKVQDALRAGRVAALIHAAEAGTDGCQRLDRMAAAAGSEIGRISVFEGRELDLAFGRAHVIHAALLAGRASASALARCRFLVDYLDQGGNRAEVGGGMHFGWTSDSAGPSAA